MTMPHLMNCPHSGSGWCLGCVKSLHDECEKLREACESIDQVFEGLDDMSEIDAAYFVDNAGPTFSAAMSARSALAAASKEKDANEL